MSNGLINRQYVGARYVPKIMGEWNKALQYEALSVVTYMGNSFTSKVPVPANVEIDNEDYWVNTGNYNAQIEEYKKEVEKNSKDIKDYSIKFSKNSITNTYFNGINVTNYEGINVKYYKTTLMDVINFYGFNSVAIVLPMYQSNVNSSDVQNTIIDTDKLHEVVEYLNNNNIKVIFHFHAETHDGTWRANIKPNNLDSWFFNYTKSLVSICKSVNDLSIAGVEIASEMTGISKNHNGWVNLINELKENINTTFSYGFDMSAGRGVEFNNYSFIDKLDYIGIDFYPQTGNILSSTSILSVEDILSMLECPKETGSVPNTITYISEVQHNYNKPIIISEYGGGFNNNTSVNIYNYYKALTIFFNKYLKIIGKFSWCIGWKDKQNQEEFAIADNDLRESINNTLIESPISPREVYRSLDFGTAGEFEALIRYNKALNKGSEFRSQIKIFNNRNNNTTTCDIVINANGDVTLISNYSNNLIPIYYCYDEKYVYFGIKRDNETWTQYYIVPIYMSHYTPIEFSEKFNITPTNVTKMTYYNNGYDLNKYNKLIKPQIFTMSINSTTPFEDVYTQPNAVLDDGIAIIECMVEDEAYIENIIVDNNVIISGGANGTLSYSGYIVGKSNVTKNSTIKLQTQYSEAGTRHCQIKVTFYPNID